MDLKFFAELSEDEADRLLANFLCVEHGVLDEMLAQAASEGVKLIVGIGSIQPLFLWILEKLRSIPKVPDPSLPNWITATDSYQRGLFAFNEPSKILVLRAGHFLGASFIDEFPKLKWGTGDRETVLQNMPVIKGFKSNIEMPPLMVTENLMRRIHGRNAPAQIIETAIETWISKI